jgi:hypothetical protein
MKLRIFLAFLVGLIIVAGLAYYLGKKEGNVQITNIATNEIFVKEIAELAALEVRGNAHIKTTNMDKGAGWVKSLKKAFLEESIEISIPYTAKYGIGTDSTEIKINILEGKMLLVKIPEPKLLSYEMHLNKATSSTQLGWLQSESNARYIEVQTALYQQSKSEASASIKNKELAAQKLTKILAQYYAPLGYEVQVQFGTNSVISLNKI